MRSNCRGLTPFEGIYFPTQKLLGIIWPGQLLRLSPRTISAHFVRKFGFFGRKFLFSGVFILRRKTLRFFTRLAIRGEL